MVRPKYSPLLAGHVRWRNRFLATLALCGNEIEAIRRAPGCTRDKLRAEMRSNPEFATQYQQAMEIALQNFEKECDRRAIQGVDKPVFYKGKQCGVVKEFSDTLLIFRMKAMNPAKYRDNPKPIDINVNLIRQQEIADTKKLLSDPTAFKLADELSRRLALPPPTSQIPEMIDGELVSAEDVPPAKASDAASNLAIESGGADELSEQGEISAPKAH